MNHQGWNHIGDGGDRYEPDDEGRYDRLERRVTDLERDRAAVMVLGRATMIIGAVLMALWSIATYVWDKVHR